MRKVLNFTLFISIVFFFIACGSITRNLKTSEVIENKDLSYLAPSNKWKIYKDINLKNYKTKALLPNLLHDKNMRMSIYTNKYYQGGDDQFFNKNSHICSTNLDGEMLFDKIDKRQGITYKKCWIAYVNNLKCSGSVFSRGFGGSYQSIGVKFYGIACGYYDTRYKENDGKRILHVDYRYTHNPNTKDGKNREKDIKDAVKKAIATLKIKNIDIKRMEKENLMHYDKEFTSTKW